MKLQLWEVYVRGYEKPAGTVTAKSYKEAIDAAAYQASKKKHEVEVYLRASA